MERVSQAGASPGEVPVSPSIQNLVTFLGNVIEEDPTLYVPYTFLAEYFTALVGPSLVESIGENCGMHDCISVVANHVQLDQAHVAEGLETFDEDRTTQSPGILFGCFGSSHGLLPRFWPGGG
jgi:hypothetical protein